MTIEEVALFWERVKEEAKKNKITMKSLFSTIQVGERSGYGWITKKVLPPANYALLIAMILNVDLTYLLWGDSPPVKEDLVLASRISKKLEEEGTPDLESRLKKIEEELTVIRKGRKQ